MNYPSYETKIGLSGLFPGPVVYDEYRSQRYGHPCYRLFDWNPNCREPAEQRWYAGTANGLYKLPEWSVELRPLLATPEERYWSGLWLNQPEHERTTLAEFCADDGDWMTVPFAFGTLSAAQAADASAEVVVANLEEDLRKAREERREQRDRAERAEERAADAERELNALRAQQESSAEKPRRTRVARFARLGVDLDTAEAKPTAAFEFDEVPTFGPVLEAVFEPIPVPKEDPWAFVIHDATGYYMVDGAQCIKDLLDGCPFGDFLEGDAPPEAGVGTSLWYWEGEIGWHPGPWDCPQDGESYLKTKRWTRMTVKNLLDGERPALEEPCSACSGSGFNGHGTGYDDVCIECGGQRTTRR